MDSYRWFQYSGVERAWMDLLFIFLILFLVFGWGGVVGVEGGGVERLGNDEVFFFGVRVLLGIFLSTDLEFWTLGG